MDMKLGLLLGTLVGVGASAALAQPEAKPEVADEWWGPGFPEAGQQLPDVEIYDAEGDPFRTSLLRGKYTVLIFGCLT